MQMQTFKKGSKRPAHCPSCANVSTFFKVISDFPEIEDLTKKLFLGICNDKFNFIQTLETNYVDTTYSQIFKHRFSLKLAP